MVDNQEVLVVSVIFLLLMAIFLSSLSDSHVSLPGLLLSTIDVDSIGSLSASF